jgi:hypothetical protein
MRGGGEIEKEWDEEEEEKNICTGISKYWFRLMRKTEWVPTFYGRGEVKGCGWIVSQENLVKTGAPPERDRPCIQSFII